MNYRTGWNDAVQPTGEASRDLYGPLNCTAVNYHHRRLTSTSPSGTLASTRILLKHRSESIDHEQRGQVALTRDEHVHVNVVIERIVDLAQGERKRISKSSHIRGSASLVPKLLLDKAYYPLLVVLR